MYILSKQLFIRNFEMTKEERKEYMKAWKAAHRESEKAKKKAWREENRDKYIAYMKYDINSLGQTKQNIRSKSLYILKQMNLKIPGYQIHHCFTYNDPTKFIYCSKELHLKIHKFLRDNNIDADSDHYEQIKQLLDENVVIFGL